MSLDPESVKNLDKSRLYQLSIINYVWADLRLSGNEFTSKKLAIL
jgi:hypothetical protein